MDAIFMKEHIKDILEILNMARRKTGSPQKAAMREMVRNYLKGNDTGIKREWT